MTMTTQHPGVRAILRRYGVAFDTGANDVIANRFITPGLSVDPTTDLPEQQDSNFPFDLNILEGGGAAEDWMMMNSQGSFW